MLKNRLPQIAAILPTLIDDALKDAADQVEQKAKERVPVMTGRLRDAIHVEKIDDGYAVIAGDTGVFYAHIVEHGGVQRGPRPFLVPAAETVRPQLEAIGRKVLGRL